MKNLLLIVLAIAFIGFMGCESDELKLESVDSVKSELRNNSNIGSIHNDILEIYYSEFGTDLDSIILFNSGKEILVTRMASIYQQLGFNIDSSANIFLSNVVDDLFIPSNSNLNAEQNYKKLVKYQYEKLVDQNLIEEDVADFIYSLSINPVDVSELSDTINNFINSNSLGNTEEEAMNRFLDVYLASHTLWTGGTGSTPQALSGWVYAADAWGGFIGGVFGTAGGPIGTAAGTAVGSAVMSYHVERAQNDNCDC